MEWADEQLRERGGELIVIGRFIPGGRTAVALSAGTLAYPWRRFIVFDVVAALVWATYAALLGYYGGRTSRAPGAGARTRERVRDRRGIELVRWALGRRRQTPA